MALPKLPIGIQSFEKLRTQGFAYVDKTPLIARMTESAAVFLSRPRRFGKSLLVDTLDLAFSGRRDLFQSLFLDRDDSGWDWTRTNPVLRFDFTTGAPNDPDGLAAFLIRKIEAYGRRFGVTSGEGSPGERLYALLEAMAAKGLEKAVVLVDEYDKPILDNLLDTPLAIRMREVLKQFYGILKPADPYLRFVFLTGVSKFSKAGVFSGLNQLNDITLEEAYGTVCGYTQKDVDTLFSPHLVKFDREVVRNWYNGYTWGSEGVYNPFDILLLCANQELRPWWFETGTPSFLIKLLREQPRSLPELDTLKIGAELSDSFEPESMSLPVMLFQTGYLTIKERLVDPEEGTRFRLGFPNHEVRMSFSRLNLVNLTGDNDGTSDNRNRLRDILEAGDGPALRDLFTAFFASIPADNYRNNQLSRYEGFYASVVYAYFASLGLSVIPEDVTNRGRIDLTVIGPHGIWIFEFKVKGLDKSGSEAPLAQILRKDYAAKYRGRTNAQGKVLPLRQVGIVFDEVARNVESWEEG
ncbi:MAG: ATP-binding protein [Spirochaetales bacterium]